MSCAMYIYSVIFFLEDESLCCQPPSPLSLNDGELGKFWFQDNLFIRRILFLIADRFIFSCAVKCVAVLPNVDCDMTEMDLLAKVGDQLRCCCFLKHQNKRWALWLVPQHDSNFIYLLYALHSFGLVLLPSESHVTSLCEGKPEFSNYCKIWENVKGCYCF